MRALRRAVKTHAKPCFLTHAQGGNGRIDITQILHIDSLGDVAIYLKRHPNWCKGLGGKGCEISTIPLTLPLASNTVYCATAHTCDAIVMRCELSYTRNNAPRATSTVNVLCITLSTQFPGNRDQSIRPVPVVPITISRIRGLAGQCILSYT